MKRGMSGFRFPLAGAVLFSACLMLNSCAGTGTREVVFTPAEWPVKVKGTVFKPETDGRAPAVLLIHGGVKLGDDGRWVMNRTARKLADRGYYVLNITYRSLNDWTYPAQLEDVREALSWMRENAEAEGIATDRIAVFGYSAGGYLGALAALDDRTGVPGIKAIVAGATPTDLSVYVNGNLMKRYFGTESAPFPEQFEEASPLLYVKRGGPPVFIYHGTSDELVRPDHAMKFADALHEHEVPHEIFWIADKGHVGAFFSSGTAVDEAIGFLDHYLK